MSTSTSSTLNIARLGACLKVDRSVIDWSSGFEHLPSLGEIENGSAINTLNTDYTKTLTAERALHSLAAAAPETAEAVHPYEHTLEQAKQGIRSLMSSTRDAHEAESAMSQLLTVADEFKPDQQALNQACTPSSGGGSEASEGG